MILDIKRFSWLLAVLLLALAFPLQVLFFNPNMALLAYVPVFLIYALALNRRVSTRERRAATRLMGLDFGVLFYSALIAGHIIVSLLVRQIALPEAFRQVFLYLLPVTFYVYVSRFAHESEFKPMLAGIVVAALIVGVYFAYDSFAKIILHQTGNYQFRAQAYSAARMGLRLDQMNQFRTNNGSRAMGLLEKHTASGAWTGLGAFASLSLLAARSKTVRGAVDLWWLMLLLAGINMSSLLGFLFTSLVVYVYPSAGIRSLLKIRRIDLRQEIPDRHAKICLGFALAVAAAVVVWFADPVLVTPLKRFLDFVQSMIALQLSKMYTVRVGDAPAYTSWFAWTFVDLKSYAQGVARHPLVLLLGTGPVMTADFLRGGDSGFLETLGLFGLPLFALIVVGLFATARGVLRELRAGAGERRRLLEFGLAVVVFVAVFEAHYSVWAYKSITPILFIALGLLRRYRRASL